MSAQQASYSETTDGIQITVTPEYVPAQSNPAMEQFLFAYHVEIRNAGREQAQLLSRHWIITDGNQQVHEVKGDGVIGEQPVLQREDRAPAHGETLDEFVVLLIGSSREGQVSGLK